MEAASNVGQSVDWGAFLGLLPMMLIGLVVHVLTKIDSARKKPDYAWDKFIRMNWIGYLIAFLLCVTNLVWMASGFDVMPGALPQFVSFVIGYGGGSLTKKLVNIANAKTTQK